MTHGAGRQIWRAATALGLAALAAVTTAGSTVATSPLHLTFQASLDDCVAGTADGTFRLRLLRGADHAILVDTVPVVTPVSGHFNACFPESPLVKAGRQLVATGISKTGTIRFTIPTLTMQVGRVPDVVKGTAPANKQVKIQVRDCSVGQTTKECPTTATRTVGVNGSGHYSKDFTSAFDIRGTDEVRVTFTSPAGHSYSRYLATPWMYAVVGTDLLFGEIGLLTTGKFRLYSKPGGTRLDTRSQTVDDFGGDFTIHFSALIKVGRQVTGNFAGDARLTIPDMTTSFSEESGKSRVRTRCLPGRKVRLDYVGGQKVAMADSHGRVNVLLPVLLDPNTNVGITCQSRAGDIVERDVLVPAL